MKSQSKIEQVILEIAECLAWINTSPPHEWPEFFKESLESSTYDDNGHLFMLFHLPSGVVIVIGAIKSGAIQLIGYHYLLEESIIKKSNNLPLYNRFAQLCINSKEGGER